MASIRQDRINEEVRKIISEIIREMKDPRISAMASVTKAELTNDLKQAKIFVSVYDEPLKKSTIDALNHAEGFIVRELGNRMQIRRLPAIKFFLDTSMEYSAHINSILSSLNIKENTDE